MIALIILTIISILIFLTIFIVGFKVIYSLYYSHKNGAPFVGNQMDVIESSLSFAELSSEDILIDLGSGDGRAVFLAVQKYNVKKAIGYEISDLPFHISKIKKQISKQSIKERTFFYKEDILSSDILEASVIYLYLFPELLEKLSDKLSEAKKRNPRLRIVSAVFSIEGLEPVKQMEIMHKGFNKEVPIYLY